MEHDQFRRGEGKGEGSVCSRGLMVTMRPVISVDAVHEPGDSLERTASSPRPSPPEEEREEPARRGSARSTSNSQGVRSLSKGESENLLPMVFTALLAGLARAIRCRRRW